VESGEGIERLNEAIAQLLKHVRWNPEKELKADMRPKFSLTQSTKPVESGEGIERYRRLSFDWDVKYRQWNPEKELKDVNQELIGVHQPKKWNPEKELKVYISQYYCLD